MSTIKKISISLFLFTMLILPFFVSAQFEVNPNTPAETGKKIEFENPFNGGNDFLSLLTVFLQKIVMPIAAVAVVLAIIWSGFTFITAQGNETKLKKAKDRLLWSLIGGGVLLGAAAISKVVVNIVNSLMN